MQQYHQLLQYVLDNGRAVADRTGTGTLSVFGHQVRFDLRAGFPLLGTKKVPFKAIAHELFWFLRGDTTLEYLHENGVTIWDEWATVRGELGAIYGFQWRSWPSIPDVQGRTLKIDQIAALVRNLNERPHSRRHVVTAWNPTYLPDESISPVANAQTGRMALAPCHCLFQFHVLPMTTDERLKYAREQGHYTDPALPAWSYMDEDMDNKGIPRYYLSCQLYQRSADVFLGVPFNIASYALLTMLVAQTCNMVPYEFVHTFGDLHLYNNHMEQAQELLSRRGGKMPTLKILNKRENLWDYTMDDLQLTGYNPLPAIPAPVAT